jgi:hypothetical protein
MQSLLSEEKRDAEGVADVMHADDVGGLDLEEGKRGGVRKRGREGVREVERSEMVHEIFSLSFPFAFQPRPPDFLPPFLPPSLPPSLPPIVPDTSD